MIQITRIPFLDPYNRRRPPYADFTTCPGCNQTYQPATRSPCCPHPVIAPTRLLTSGAQHRAQLALRRRKIPSKRGPLVLKDPLYEQQVGEGDKRFKALTTYLALEENRSYAAVARKLGKSKTLIERWAKEDKWSVRLDAYNVDKARERFATLRKMQRKDTEDMFKLVRALGRITASELAERVRLIDMGQKLGMSDGDLLKAMDLTIKDMRLLYGESTENISADTPAMKEERKIRDIVHDIQKAIQERELSHPDESPEDRGRFIELRIKWAEEDYQISTDVLTQAVLGHITTSNAEN